MIIPQEESDDHLIELARDILPLPSEVKVDYYRVPVLIKPKVNFTQLTPIGTVTFREVVFFKEYVRGIAIGWRLDYIK